MRPSTALRLNPSLRSSGLLAALPSDELKSLLFVLTFVHPNGYCHASVPELCHWMRLSEMRLRGRMRRLAEFQWQGRPILIELKRESGLDAYTPSPDILEVVERVLPREDSAAPSSVRIAGREAVIAHSRATYARPRAQVEQIIAEQLGHSPEEFADTPQGEARRRLLALGVPADEVERLMSDYSVEEVLQQLSWLPERGARNPARFIVAAITNRYEAPVSQRLSTSVGKAEVRDQGDNETTSRAIPFESDGGRDD